MVTISDMEKIAILFCALSFLHTNALTDSSRRCSRTADKHVECEDCIGSLEGNKFEGKYSEMVASSQRPPTK